MGVPNGGGDHVDDLFNIPECASVPATFDLTDAALVIDDEGHVIPMMLTTFGLIAVSAMLLCYALESPVDSPTGRQGLMALHSP